MTKRIAKECINCGTCLTNMRSNKYCSKKCYDVIRNAQFISDKKLRCVRLVGAAKVRSESTGLPFNITTEYLMGLWDSTDGTCAITGIPFQLVRLGTRRPHPYAPSIDKINPKLGYVEGNIRLVCYQTNVAISDFGLEQFEKFVDLYIQNKRMVT